MVISDLSNTNRNENRLHETVTHQKSGIINLLFFLFLSPYRISPATFTLNTKSSSWNLHAIFLVQISLATLAFWKKIFYCWVFFICLPYFMPPPSQSQIALDWFCCSNWKPVSSSFPCWTLTWLLSSSPEKQVAYQGPVPQKRYSSSPLAGELSWLQPQLRSSEKSDQCGYTGSSLWTWSITRSLGLVVDKQLGQGQGRKHERSPTGNSVGTPSILANWIPRLGLGLLSIYFIWWKFLTKT